MRAANPDVAVIHHRHVTASSLWYSCAWLASVSWTLFGHKSILHCHCYRSININGLRCFPSASYFCYDNPGALQNYFMKDMDMSTTQFVWLYSIYSWPNVVLCFIGGFLMDRFVVLFFSNVLFWLKFSFPESPHTWHLTQRLAFQILMFNGIFSSSLCLFTFDNCSVFGIRFGTILYMFILMIGQLIVAFGTLLDAFW